MNYKSILIFAVLFFSISFNLAIAQPMFHAGVKFTGGFPRGEFNDNVDNTGLGLTGTFFYNIEHKPLAIGASMGFLIYGHDTRTEPFSSAIPDVRVDVTTTNNILMGHLVLRAQSPEGLGGGAIVPYFDAMFGFHFLYTETSVSDSDAFGSEEDIASSTNYDDFTMSYGGGGGFMIRVYDSSRDAKGIEAVYIDLGVHFLQGGEAKYLKEGDIDRSNGNVTYNPSQSETDLLNFHLGVAFYF
ncbi:hypothetical protein GF337_02325 [candidate division KSB1 bacterium]|nr:hypothetical protein [candidate division KSB1 bacterium]